MSPNGEAPEEASEETQEGSAGEAQVADEASAQAAEAPATLPDDELDARQAAIAERRRTGGPPRDGDAEAAGAQSAGAPEVPATECEEPAAEPA